MRAMSTPRRAIMNRRQKNVERIGRQHLTEWTEASDSATAIAFETDLGWMATLIADGKLSRLLYGLASRGAALRELAAWPVSSVMDEQRCQGLARRLRDRLRAYATGKSVSFGDVPLALDHLTEFGRRVLLACQQIPFGQTLSYSALATRAGAPRAARAVGSCMARNRTPLVVPCHRVVNADGSIGAYSAAEGPRMKARLLALEMSARSERDARTKTRTPSVSRRS